MKKICKVCEFFQIKPDNLNIKELKEFLKDTICEFIDRGESENNDLVDNGECCICVKEKYSKDFDSVNRFIFSRKHANTINLIKFETNRSTITKPEKLVLYVSSAFIENALIDSDDPTFELGTYDGFEPYLSIGSKYVTAKFIKETNQYEVYSKEDKTTKLYSKVEFEAMYKHLKDFV